MLYDPKKAVSYGNIEYVFIQKRIVEKLLASLGREKSPNDWRGCVELIYGRNLNKLSQPFRKQWCIDVGSLL